VPNWPAPADLVQLGEKWGRPEILALRNLSTPGNEKELARQFLEKIRLIQIERDKLFGPVAATTLKDMIAQIRSDGQSSAVITQRQEAFVEWARGRALLLATPESGVGVDTAGELLSAFPENPVLPPASGPDLVFDPVHQARFNRARVALETMLGKPISSEDVNSTLTAIDNSFSGHPWVTRFHPWTGRPTADEQ
jgi:hypothetical protein